VRTGATGVAYLGRSHVQRYAATADAGLIGAADPDPVILSAKKREYSMNKTR